MENKQRNFFKGSEYLNSDFDRVIRKIFGKRTKIFGALPVPGLKDSNRFNLKDIKQLAIDIRKDSYSISNKTNNNQSDDPFLNSPYFDFIAEIWNCPEELSGSGPLKDRIEFVNYLIKAGFDVKKNKG